jgi:putative tryptophan/tyrosine transport system substrate-binding protein
VKRREFIAGLGGVTVAGAWACPLHAQQALPVIGILGATTADGYASQLAALRDGLRDMGFVEDRNVAIEYRWANGQYERLPALAADLAARKVNVIATIGGSAAVVAAKAAAATVPIVFHGSLDPVAVGFAASLNRPGGNVTGVMTLNAEMGPKRLEFLREIVPTAASVGFLINPANPISGTQVKEMQGAARMLGLELHIVPASAAREFEAVFASLARLKIGGLVISTDGFFISHSEALAAIAIRHKMPAVFQYRAFATAGGLMSYGGDPTDSYRLAGVYAARILKGEKPADLPIQQATKIEMLINLKTAKAMGISVPIALLARANEVIE